MKKMLLQVLFTHKKALFAWGRQTDTPLTERHTTFRITEMKNSNRMKHRILCIALLLVCLISANNIYAQGAKALTHEAIENYLFDQQYYAYRCGRLNKENGVGKRWYHRFTLMHITDVHANYDL